MTSTELSSEGSSDVYISRRQRNTSRNLSSKVGHLASKLQDTNKTLKVVDQMLDDYKGLGDQQSSVMERLRVDLDNTTEQLQDEKMRRSLRESVRSLRPSDLDDDLPRDCRRRDPTSPLREYDHPVSDAEYTRRRRRQVRGAVRFFDDMDAGGGRHTIHQSLRDLTGGQLRLEDDLSREVARRTQLDAHHRRSMSDLRSTQLDPPKSSVDRRLLSIQDELRVERASLKKRQEEVGKISTELKEALQLQKGSTRLSTVPGGADDVEYRARLVQVEAQKSQTETELETVRRRLDQAEGGRELLLDQTDELRAQLQRSDQERQRLHALVAQQDEEGRDRRKHRSVEEYELQQVEADRRRLQEEVRDLRAQISKSASMMGEYSEMRRELERSEKQRMQLSDHIQVLNKDLEAKEKQSLRAVGQLQELTSRYQDADQHSHSSLTQLEDTLRRLRDVTQTAEAYSGQLKELQRKLCDSEKRREDIKNRAQETVRQWKAKCKKLEKECERRHHTAASVTEQHKVLTKEAEGLRLAATSGGQQMETMRRQLAELLAMRAQMDEHIRIRDVEVNELKSLKMDLERDLRDCKVVIDRLEQELRGANEKATSFFEERNKLEEQVGSLQTAHYMAQSQLQHLQNELKAAGMEKVELSTQLAELAGERNELRNGLAEMRQLEAASRDEVTQLTKSMKEEHELQGRHLAALRADAEQSKAHEQHVVSEMSRRYKKERAEYEAEVQALRLEIQEERSLAKLHRKQHEKVKAEVERLHRELAESQEETEAGRRKYHKIKEDILSKAQATEDGLGRVKEMELHLLDTKETLMRVEKDYQNILYSIGVEVDSVVEVAALDSVETYKALTPLKAMPSEPKKWFAETKGKLCWLRSQLRERQQRENLLRSSIREVMETGGREQHFGKEQDAAPPRGTHGCTDSSVRPVPITAELGTRTRGCTDSTGRPASSTAELGTRTRGCTDSAVRSAPNTAELGTRTRGCTDGTGRPPFTTAELGTRTREYGEHDFQNTNLIGYMSGLTEEFGSTQEMERELAIHQSFLAEQEKEDLVANIHSVETEKEREKIHERYAKLQKAMVSLRHELTSQKHDTQQESPSSSPCVPHYRLRPATPPVQDPPKCGNTQLHAGFPPLTDHGFPLHFVPPMPASRQALIM